MRGSEGKRLKSQKFPCAFPIGSDLESSTLLVFKNWRQLWKGHLDWSFSLPCHLLVLQSQKGSPLATWQRSHFSCSSHGKSGATQPLSNNFRCGVSTLGCVILRQAFLELSSFIFYLLLCILPLEGKCSLLLMAPFLVLKPAHVPLTPLLHLCTSFLYPLSLSWSALPALRCLSLIVIPQPLLSPREEAVRSY
jgi:hypothetical protein